MVAQGVPGSYSIVTLSAVPPRKLDGPESGLQAMPETFLPICPKCLRVSVIRRSWLIVTFSCHRNSLSKSRKLTSASIITSVSDENVPEKGARVLHPFPGCGPCSQYVQRRFYDRESSNHHTRSCHEYERRREVDESHGTGLQL